GAGRLGRGGREPRHRRGGRAAVRDHARPARSARGCHHAARHGGAVLRELLAAVEDRSGEVERVREGPDGRGALDRLRVRPRLGGVSRRVSRGLRDDPVLQGAPTSAGSAGGASAAGPVAAGILLGGVALVIVYVAISRFGMKVPLKPFFAVTSAMLYYMAFVFAGKGIADLQESGILGTSVVEWAPRIPVLGIYPTVQSLSLQFLLIVLLLVAVVWLHRNRLNGAEPDRRRASFP